MLGSSSIAITPTKHPTHGRIWRLTATQTLDHPVESVFPFFADAHNLEKLTPRFLNFNVLTPPSENGLIPMHSGAQIRYKLRVRGLPIRWTTTILDWDPPRKFIDTQDSGPYTLWHHTHTFTPLDNNTRTLCTDEVLYKPKGWILAPLINTLAVERDVKKIFQYRFDMLAKIFPPREAPIIDADDIPMHTPLSDKSLQTPEPALDRA